MGAARWASTQKIRKDGMTDFGWTKVEDGWEKKMKGRRFDGKEEAKTTDNRGFWPSRTINTWGLSQ
tara:strand:+ start:4579 stop:4776 length:198 start_codon:yes stop_codon:yes gene_type:complete